MDTDVEFKSRYVAKKADSKGYIHYIDDEHSVWSTLFERQMKLIPGRACDEFVAGVEKLALNRNEIPQIPDINNALEKITGWRVQAVAALITPDEFFHLLASKTFPAATFIRTREELDYVTEPDIFHEIFGHCPMLTEPTFASFIERYAKMVLKIDKKEWPLLQRLFWFTVEFGLIKTPKGIRAYGGGILSSIEETSYSIESSIAKRKPFSVLDVLRTPYRIDCLQVIYFVIDNFKQLYDIMDADIPAYLAQAHKRGEFPPEFKVEEGAQTIHINAC